MAQRTAPDRPAGSARRSLALALAGALALSGCATGADRTGPQTDVAQKAQAQTSLQAMLRLAARTEGSGNLGAAREIYANAVKDYPEAPAAYLGLARVTYGAGRPEAAAEHYRDALRFAPQSAEARYGLGKSLLSSDRPEAAIEQFDRLIAGDGKDHRPYLAKGVALDLLARHAEAQTAYRAGLEIAPRNVALRNNLGLSLALGREHKAAMRVLEEAARDPKATARTRQNLALVYGLAGQMHEAETTGRTDLQPHAVERNLSFYEALRSARKVDETAPDSRQQAAADPQPRRHQVAATTDDPSEPSAAETPPTTLIAATPAGAKSDAGTDAEPSAATAETRESVTAAPIGSRPHPAETPEASATDSSVGLAGASAAPTADTQGAEAPTPEAQSAEAAPATAPAGENEPTAQPVAFTANPASPPELRAAGRAYWVQIASFGSAETSRQEWQRLQSAHPDLLAELELSLQQAQVADKGTFYRVRTGPFAGVSAPKRLCEALKARDQGCLVVESEVAS